MSQQPRYLDKLIDEPASGRKMENIWAKHESTST
ncbi:DUF2200 family protein [Roseivirga sp. E12]|nr:DUF2200 family protein [Roseivirga sp. E12]